MGRASSSGTRRGENTGVTPAAAVVPVATSWAPAASMTKADPIAATPPTADAEPCVYINPVFSEPTGAVVAFEEGCLSLPEIRGQVLRPPQITIGAVDLDGRAFTRTGGGLLARCWQHEMDHLDGVLIIDKMTQIYRLKNRAAIRELEAEWDAGRP